MLWVVGLKPKREYIQITPGLSRGLQKEKKGMGFSPMNNKQNRKATVEFMPPYSTTTFFRIMFSPYEILSR